MSIFFVKFKIIYITLQTQRLKTMENKKALVEYSGVEIERSGQTIISDVNFQLFESELITIDGSIGSGKTSLFKTLYADLPIKKGSARVLDFELNGIPERKISKLRRRMGIIFQDYQLFDTKTVSGNLEFVIDSLGFKTPCPREEYINNVLGKVGIIGKAGSFTHMLSGGERQSVAIARAIVCKPEIIIADEPTGNLDEQSARHIAKLLYSLSQEGTSVIVATHDGDVFKEFQHRELHVENGKLIS